MLQDEDLQIINDYLRSTGALMPEIMQTLKSRKLSKELFDKLASLDLRRQNLNEIMSHYEGGYIE